MQKFHSNNAPLKWHRISTERPQNFYLNIWSHGFNTLQNSDECYTWVSSLFIEIISGYLHTQYCLYRRFVGKISRVYRTMTAKDTVIQNFPNRAKKMTAAVTCPEKITFHLNKFSMCLLSDTHNCRLCKRHECRESFLCHRFKRKPLVSDPDMHHGMCVTKVPWCISGSLTHGGGEIVPGIPGACATRNITYLVRDPSGDSILFETILFVRQWPVYPVYDIQHHGCCCHADATTWRRHQMETFSIVMLVIWDATVLIMTSL